MCTCSLRLQFFLALNLQTERSRSREARGGVWVRGRGGEEGCDQVPRRRRQGDRALREDYRLFLATFFCKLGTFFSQFGHGGMDVAMQGTSIVAELRVREEDGGEEEEAETEYDSSDSPVSLTPVRLVVVRPGLSCFSSL